MKKLVFLVFLVINLSLMGQGDCPYYQRYINKGDQELSKGPNANFEVAINAYSTAMVHCPEKADEAQAKILTVFKAIEQLKTEAEISSQKAINAKQRTLQALQETEAAKAKTQEALSQANQLIHAFYFYADRFALAYGDKDGNMVFYFIDKEGNEVAKLGRWERAEQFDWRGFGVVKSSMEQTPYLLDTFGNVYPVAYSIEDLDEDITALDLQKKRLDSIPKPVF